MTNSRSKSSLQKDLSTGDIQAVRRAGAVLALFSTERPELTVAEGARLLKLNRTTTSRYFTSMETAGLLERSPDSTTHFRPSRTMTQLGALALGQRSITRVAPPVMRDLSAQTRLTVALSLWGTAGPVVVHSESHNDWGAVVTVRVGTQLPLNAAQSQVFLAWHGDQMLVDRMLSTLFNDERSRLTDQLRVIRTETIGCQVSFNGMSIFAVPVFDSRGICAALAMLGTSTMSPIDASPRETKLVLDAGRRLTEMMGGRWPMLHQP